MREEVFHQNMQAVCVKYKESYALKEIVPLWAKKINEPQAAMACWNGASAGDWLKGSTESARKFWHCLFKQ